MGHWLLAFVTAYGAVFLLELPDKVAFALQSVIAVALGSAITLLPERIVAGSIAILLAVGAFLLLRESLESDTDEADGAGPASRDLTPFVRAAMISFGTLFLTEWGDASQVTAIGVAARYASPVAVGTGTFLALMSVTALALLVGRKLRAHVPAHFIQRGAAVVFTVFALIAAYEAIF